MFGENEVNFQGILANEIKKLSKEKRFSGINISDTKEGKTIKAKGFTSRQADIICFEPDHTPFLIIETKKEKKDRSKQIQPLDQEVIGQALSYAYLYKLMCGVKPKAIMTANESRFSAFIVPDDLKTFLNIRYVKSRDYSKCLNKGAYTNMLKEYLIDTGKYQITDLTMIMEKIASAVNDEKTLTPNVSKAIVSLMNDFISQLTPYIERKVNSSIYKMALSEKEKEEITHFVNGDYNLFSRILSYILMNKIITYRLLEKDYNIPTMVTFQTPNNMLNQLNKLFKYVKQKTNDFDGIFVTGIFDKIDIPETRAVMEVINSFINTLENIDASNFVYYIGYTYENVIPADERHKLGEFYTPGPIAEFITRWAIRSVDDCILDPGTGSGTFLSKAYRLFAEMILGNYTNIEDEVHKRILEKLYGLDINPFAIQLSILNLALHNLKASSNRVNLKVMNYFTLNPDKLPPNEDSKEINDYTNPFSMNAFYYRHFDAIVGNPPYTRWTDIDDETKDYIKKAVSEKAKKYGITLKSMPGRQGSMPGIYIYWILHSDSLLNDNGRIGVIISDLWLQTSYGKNFQKFLLDNYKIVALIDFRDKVFEVPLVSTVVLLLEKEKDQEKRNSNIVKFISVGENINVLDLLKVVRNEDINIDARKIEIEQEKLKEQDSWFMFFKYKKPPIFWNNDIFVPLSTFFDVSKGNTQWHIEEAQGTGADNFFFLDTETAMSFNMELNKLQRAVRNTRDVIYFTLKENDIKENESKDRPTYFFTRNEPKQNLEPWAQKYIKWGESPGCKGSESKGGSICSESKTCRSREKNQKYGYWYNLGYIKSTLFLATYSGWNKTRFTLNNVNDLVLGHSLLAFFPKDGISIKNNDLLAILAYLNSSYAQLYIELKGRKTGGGAIALEVNIANEMPVPDIRKLNESTKEKLASLFLELDNKAREIKGAISKLQLNQLADVIDNIDSVIDKLLENTQGYVPLSIVKSVLKEFMDKRRADSGDVNNPIVGTEKDELITNKKKRSRRVKIEPSSTLDKFSENDQENDHK